MNDLAASDQRDAGPSVNLRRVFEELIVSLESQGHASKFALCGGASVTLDPIFTCDGFIVLGPRVASGPSFLPV